MQRGRQIGWLVLLVCLLLPWTAWAAEVPEITADEYRYMLEYEASAGGLAEAGEMAVYSNDSLRYMIKRAAEAEKEPGHYRALLELALLDQYGFAAHELDQFGEAELEKLLARAMADEVYTVVAQYQLAIEPADYTPQEIVAMYYKNVLDSEYEITDGVEGLTWYQLEDLYHRAGVWQSLQEEYGVTEDLSAYSYEELTALRARLIEEKSLRVEYGVTADLSGYTDEELEELCDRCYYEKQLRVEYGLAEDLSGYTVSQLGQLYEDLEAEAAEQERRQREAEARARVYVQVNGETLYFPDGAQSAAAGVGPVLKDGRVYVPFRTVFEALGAEVTYDATSKTVTAKRGSRTVSLAAGQPCYVLDGVTIASDGQTFVQGGRIFVPVRFVSQALGAAVGWDAAERTVVILEREKLLQRYQGQFTVLEQYLQHWDLGQGSWALAGNWAFALQVSGTDLDTDQQAELPLAFTVELEELASADAVNMDAAVQLDGDELATWLQESGRLDEAIADKLGRLKNFRLQCILDVGQGRWYVKSELLDLLEGQQDAWYSLDIADFLDGADYARYKQLLAVVQERKQQRSLDLDSLLAELINGLSVTDSYNAADTLGLLDGLLHVVGDQWLGKTAEGYEHSKAADNGVYHTKLVFQGDQNALTGLQLTADAELGDLSFHFLLEEQEHVLQCSVQGYVDSLGTQITLYCDGNFAYSGTDAQPARRPEDGSPVYDFMELLEDYEDALYSEQAAVSALNVE